MKKVAVSGYFIWVHIGHIELFKRAKELGDLYVIVNNDQQQILKYGKVIVPIKERVDVLKSLKYIDKVVESIDSDRSVCKTVEKLRPDIFANGGDRLIKEIPEAEICRKYNIQLVDGLGRKIQSSSALLKSL
jgi:cytidyltransferase-like protein